MSLAPRPNFRTQATFEEMAEWMAAVARGDWSWCWNGRCKYVSLHIDTRSGAYRLQDRDGKEISLVELLHQHRLQPTDIPPNPTQDKGA